MYNSKRYLVTAALPYANGPLHIGHLAGAYINSDIYVRYLRMMGKEVVFVCGSDEHGAAITMRAHKEGVTPREIIDKYHVQFEDTFKRIGIQFDEYFRTSDPLHHQTSQDFFRTLYENGSFEEHVSQQYFDVEANQFLADRYIIGTCPKCSNEDAYGDQCEKCGSTLSPTELINPRSALSGAKPELRETTHWYLPLNKHEDWLKVFIDEGKVNGVVHHDPSEWKAHVLGQCRSWLDGGLQPRAMTRDLDWGVDVPKEIPGSEGKKLYVWLDAPIGYISATINWANKNGKDWQTYWKDEETELIHFIGKDNIVFHCIIFPAILKAHEGYNLPINVPANQFMNLEGRKISTSRGWAIWVHEYLDEFPGKEDVLRYALIKGMPETRDSEFTWKGYQEYNNTELVNNLANFINRVMVLSHKYYEGVVPEFDPDQMFISNRGEEDMPGFHDSELVDLFDKLQEVGDAVTKFDFREGMKVVMEVSSMGNQILQFNEPWKQVKEDPEEVKAVLNLCLQYVHALAIAIRPFLPFTSDKIAHMLNISIRDEDSGFIRLLDELSEGFPPLKSGHQLGKPEHLFTRIDDGVIQKQVDKLFTVTNSEIKEENHNDTSVMAPLKDNIDFSAFAGIDLRVGKILQAEKVEKADKLLKLEIDLGFEKRVIVSGIAQHFKPQEIIGETVVVVANLASKQLRGIESKGMILMAEGENGSLEFVRAIGNVLPGSIIS